MTDKQKEEAFLKGELDRENPYIIVEIIEYVPNSVVSKTIMRKSSGNISLMSFDSGE